MISDRMKRLVERTFPDDSRDHGDHPAFRLEILDALEAGKSLASLGGDRGCHDWEIAALRKIEHAFKTGVIPESV